MSAGINVPSGTDSDNPSDPTLVQFNALLALDDAAALAAQGDAVGDAWEAAAERSRACHRALCAVRPTDPVVMAAWLRWAAGETGMDADLRPTGRHIADRLDACPPAGSTESRLAALWREYRAAGDAASTASDNGDDLAANLEGPLWERFNALSDEIETTEPANLIDLTAQLRKHADDLVGSCRGDSHEILNVMADWLEGYTGVKVERAFNPESWVRRAAACGLAIVTEDGIDISPDVQGPEVDALLSEWRGGSEEQRKRNTGAACTYVRVNGAGQVGAS